MRKILLALLLGSSMVAAAQQKDRRQKVTIIREDEEEGVISSTGHFAAGAKLANDGYGGFLELGRSRNGKRGLLFQLDISERKHQKEEKIYNMVNGVPFIFGKINYFYPIKLGVQQQILLGNKSNKNGVNLTANFGGGLNLGLLKSYAIEANDNGQVKYLYWQGPDSLAFLNVGSMDISQPSLFRGWKKVTMVPGAYVKAAIRFDYSLFNDLMNAIEIGVYGDIYSKKIDQMIYQKPKQIFYSPYVSIIFGKRR